MSLTRGLISEEEKGLGTFGIDMAPAQRARFLYYGKMFSRRGNYSMSFEYGGRRNWPERSKRVRAESLFSYELSVMLGHEIRHTEKYPANGGTETWGPAVQMQSL
jgi:hypothetical protein